jgi:capsular polysaccharide biosynthesis protein
MYEDIYSLTNLLQAIWRRAWTIILVAIVLTGATVGFSLLQTPMYESSIKLFIGQENAIVETPSDVTGLQQLTLTMAEGVSTRPIAEAVIRQESLRISPQDLLDNLSVEQIGATQFIQVTYEDSSPKRAQRVANAIGEAFSKKVSDGSSTANAVSATVWERAALPSEPVSPNPMRNGLLTLVAALMLGVGLTLLLKLLDDSWHSPEEVEQITGVLTIGVIPQYSTARMTKKIT